MHIHQCTCNIKNNTISVYCINIKRRFCFNFTVFIPMGFYPALRFKAMLYILRNIYTVSLMNGKSVTPCNKSDNFLAGRGEQQLAILIRQLSIPSTIIPFEEDAFLGLSIILVTAGFFLLFLSSSSFCCTHL